MLENATSQEQKEFLKQWWNGYGKAIVIAIIVGIAIGYGWRFWQHHKTERALAASQAYQQLVIAQHVFPKQFDKMAHQLIKKYSGTPYADFASMMVAKEQVGNKQYKQALLSLEWVVHNSQSDALMQLAKIRAARVALVLKQPNKAMQLVSKVNYKGFMPLVDSVRGDAQKALGNNKQAEVYYKKASAGLAEAKVNDSFISLKASQP